MPIASHNFRLIRASQFLSALIFTIPIWIPYYRQTISITEVSFLISFQYAIQLFLELPTGAFADIFGKKMTVFIGYLAVAIQYLLLINTPTFALAFIATIFGGLSDALISGALEALLYDSYKQDGDEDGFRKASASNSFWFQIGLAIGTFGGGFLYPIWNGLPYLLSGLCSLGATILTLFCIEPKIDSVKFSIQGYLTQIQVGTHHAFRSLDVAKISLFYIFVGGITWTNQLFFNSYMLVELGFSDHMRSFIGAGQRLVNVFILRSLLKNEQIFNRKRSIYFFPVMMLLGFLPGVVYNGWLAIPFISLALMAGTARWIVLSKYTNDVFESRYRATAISALSMIIGIIYIGITFISGPIIENLGGVRTMYTLLGIMTLCTVVPLSFAVAKEKKVL